MAGPNPEDIFPASYTAGMALCTNIDVATPEQTQLATEDSEKLLLYVSTSVVRAATISPVGPSCYTAADLT